MLLLESVSLERGGGRRERRPGRKAAPPFASARPRMRPHPTPAPSGAGPCWAGGGGARGGGEKKEMRRVIDGEAKGCKNNDQAKSRSSTRPLAPHPSNAPGTSTASKPVVPGGAGSWQLPRRGWCGYCWGLVYAHLVQAHTPFPISFCHPPFTLPPPAPRLLAHRPRAHAAIERERPARERICPMYRLHLPPPPPPPSPPLTWGSRFANTAPRRTRPCSARRTPRLFFW